MNIYYVLNLLIGQLSGPSRSLFYGLAPYVVQSTGRWIRFVRTSDEQTQLDTLFWLEHSFFVYPKGLTLMIPSKARRADIIVYSYSPVNPFCISSKEISAYILAVVTGFFGAVVLKKKSAF